MNHPYQDQPSYQRWKHSVAGVETAQFDPLENFPFCIDQTTKVATAGSCFAQHIARRLSSSGYNYFVTEPGHALASVETRKKHQYGLFSARFGNIYTTRQLIQLLQEALGERKPALMPWQFHDRYVDPLRPNVEPDGFVYAKEVELDRAQHLKAVRRMLEEADILIFTLGLTEAWVNKADGTVFPVCPGVRGGTFNPDQHKFHNFSVSEISDDIRMLCEIFDRVNPKAKIILTVSPVPLIATAEDRNVLVSTTYSKAVLRVCADEAVKSNPERIAYFPSYEIITGNFNRGVYFAPDLRSVTPQGVDHVMRVFFRHVTVGKYDSTTSLPNLPVDENLTHDINEATLVICEEELLDASKA